MLYFIVKPKLIFLSEIPSLRHRLPVLEFTPKSEITFLLCRLLSLLSVHQPRLVITTSPQYVPGMDPSSVMMMEVTLNRPAVSVTDREAALATNKAQNEENETLLI